MTPAVLHATVIVAAVLGLAGCGRATGDFGRAERNVVDDSWLPALGDQIARHGRGELVSDFNRTDREGVLRDRAWSLVRPPHARDWFGASLVEWQRTRILPTVDPRFDPDGYYNYLRRDPFRSSEARWNRMIADMRADAALVGPFWAEARRVRDDDRARLGEVDGRRDVAPPELKDAYARIDENARVVDWVWRSMRLRLAAYRRAIDRIEVETPSDRLYTANLAWNALKAAVDAAERDFPAAPHGTAPEPPGRSRYATGAGIHEDVPQK
ncbi:hypothetical protein EYW49_02260 [Siculibacillus lacustris]|uniref:Uncharacterized protein n=1 Tax=Siculibacillus lacustris TaxID=1549641 RepID=A0A4Q9VX86_9HYPH|nr:hypothetical protein [Siculibacillus lacustris]TBW41000.1 hypothetical protein EYW49_02260 [Siculibacillus lacustris]